MNRFRPGHKRRWERLLPPLVCMSGVLLVLSLILDAVDLPLDVAYVLVIVDGVDVLALCIVALVVVVRAARAVHRSPE